MHDLQVQFDAKDGICVATDDDSEKHLFIDVMCGQKGLVPHVQMYDVSHLAETFSSLNGSDTREIRSQLFGNEPYDPDLVKYAGLTDEVIVRHAKVRLLSVTLRGVACPLKRIEHVRSEREFSCAFPVGSRREKEAGR